MTDYCRKNNIAIYDFYCDDGVSGVTFQRPNFTRMMIDVDSGNVNTVIVKDLSRFGRNYIDGGKYLEEIFPEKGIRFIAIGDEVNSDRENIDLDFTFPLKNIFNQFYLSLPKTANKTNGLNTSFPCKYNTHFTCV